MPCRSSAASSPSSKGCPVKTIPLLLAILSSPALAAATAKAPSLPADLEDFLGPPPAKFEQKFRKPALELKAAFRLLGEKKDAQAISKLQAISSSEMGEHAGFELGRLLSEKKDFAKSSTQLEKLLRQYPGSVYADKAKDLLDHNECELGLQKKGAEGQALLQRCLWRASWKSWGSELDPQANALYTQLKSTKDPLFEPFVAELIQALPSSAPLRQRIAKELSGDKLDKLADLARFRSKSVNAAGVKAVSPDLELFESAMKLVHQEDWEEANALFRRFPAEFPQSEHWERAQFWIARTEERMGNKDEAKKRFEQILSENPFTYYGLQAAIYLKHDWAGALANGTHGPQASKAAVKFEGSVVTRQAVSLWRLRALLEAGLIEVAREEAKFLFHYKPGGATLGQDKARGALLMARLFGEAGYHLGAFSHAYAALSLEPSLLESSSVRMIFPDIYESDFRAAGEKTGVHPLLLASVAKQESAFLPNAVSRADALGLMQLLLPTAKEVATVKERDDLFRPALNLQAGALYLHKLLLRFENNIAFALAAYNAGPSRMSSWQKDFVAASPLLRRNFDPDAFIDSIPFTETRKYVANILRNYAWYKLLGKDGNISSIQELSFQWQKPASVLQLKTNPPDPKTSTETQTSTATETSTETQTSSETQAETAP